MALTLPVFLQPILTLLGMGLGIGALLGFVARKFHTQSDPVIEQINDLLPQTQCGQCGYPGCKPYAQAIADGAAINKCPPGGEKTIHDLANLLNVSVIPLDESHGSIEPRKVAFIREEECIGCAKCIPACPVDAIVGANKYMHTVIASECTGCDLCVDPCPVDCIDMLPVEPDIETDKGTDTGPGIALNVITAQYNACINCGLCIDECPVDILPHELYRACRLGELEQAQQLKLMHCIECSKCDDACPAHIPLTGTYQSAMQALHSQVEDKHRAERAKWRFQQHQRRMEILQAEDERRRQKRAELARQNRQKVSTGDIKAALERVKAKRNNQDNDHA